MSTLPATMTCVEIKKPGGPEALVPATRPVPLPKDGEILVKVAAAGVNHRDTCQASRPQAPWRRWARASRDGRWAKRSAR